MSEHPWCRSPSRDEAVRAAEDNRTGPLPTLEEAIANITHKGDHMGTKSDEKAADYRCEASGLRTERVTLEITHDGKHGPLAQWPFECGSHGESVRVVEEVHFDDLAQVAMERDAAIRERDEAKSFWMGELRSRTAERDAANERRILVAEELSRVRDRVAELESAPAASGWLTPEEREAVEWLSQLDQYAARKHARVAQALLARSSPTEVVRPGTQVRYHSMSVEDQRDAQWIVALAAAGVTVKEVGK